jgi:EPS-associated MarR family transcriptional regulator
LQTFSPRLLTVIQHDGSVPKNDSPLIQTLQTPVTSRRSQIQEDTNFRVLRMLQDNPDLTQREIAQKLGISTSGLNYCLKALIDKGWVKVHNFSQSKNKFGYIYLLTPAGISQKAQMTAQFLQRKLLERQQLTQEIQALTNELKEGQAPDFNPSGGASDPRPSRLTLNI